MKKFFLLIWSSSGRKYLVLGVFLYLVSVFLLFKSFNINSFIELYISQSTISTFFLLYLIYLIPYSFHISVVKDFHRINRFSYSIILSFLLRMGRDYYNWLQEVLIQNLLQAHIMKKLFASVWM